MDERRAKTKTKKSKKSKAVETVSTPAESQDCLLVTVEGIGAQGGHCHVQDFSLRFFVLCDQVHYPTGSSHQEMQQQYSEDAQPPPVVLAGGKPQQNGDESSQSAVAGPSGASSSSKGSKSSTAPATKRSFQDMKGKSEVFKSLFTTHSSAKRSKDQTSNWVTHTPYHF
ncbi:hypothetical protein ATANTOWER_004526 [Ataeniobius toweri]|uniref:Uncharacterized protein n=1 Tax=Ataeniobius toweri TaxID=208326 RepID=A0ABU7ASL6_9TELE|nr:hypothetical protein [Ataeniobius toweri]